MTALSNDDIIGFRDNSITCWNCGYVYHFNFYTPSERDRYCPKCKKLLMCKEDKELVDLFNSLLGCKIEV